MNPVLLVKTFKVLQSFRCAFLGFRGT